MALSALWQRCVSWSSAIAQLLQPFFSRGTSCPTGTRTQLPPPAPLASSHGIAPPSGNALGGARGCRKPLAPVPSVRDTQHGPTRSANTSGTPLGRGSPPDTSVPMDLDTTPALDISLGSDVPMDDDSPSGCDLSLASDVTMDEDSPSGRDLSLASDVTMDEDSPSGRDLSLASDVTMDEDSPSGRDLSLATDDPMDGGSPSGSDHVASCDISLSSDVPMDEDTFPRADISLPSHSTASHPGPLHGQAIGAHGVTPASDTGLRRKVPPKRTRSHLHCSQGAVGTSRDDRSSIPMPTAHAGPSGTSPQPKNASLCPPKKMPSTDRSVPKSSRAVLSTGHCNTGGTKPQDPQQGAGTDLPPPQSSVSPRNNIALQRRGRKRKRGSGFSPKQPADIQAVTVPRTARRTPQVQRLKWAEPILDTALPALNIGFHVRRQMLSTPEDPPFLDPISKHNGSQHTPKVPLTVT
ncbi:cell surface glycoprotein 1-like [Manacus candei]|uniref:cell surface glycoprotein 1-like n=1 Tax=Manacus candei TaxID=415023 RepID=UPI002226309B|nr:cell surface glycoprotein 1-like [Manacus candei]